MSPRANTIRASIREPGAYLPLFWRIVLANVVVLLTASVAVYIVLSQGRISELATDELLITAIGLVTVVNLVMVRRLVVPLQQLAADARSFDPTRPHDRVGEASVHSEAGELAQAFNEMLERLEHERADASRRVLAAHEAERLRVAQELHDEVGQTLTAVLLQLSRVQGRVGDGSKLELAEVQETVRASLEDVRRIATELRPETLAELGLPSALATLARTFAERTGIAVNRHIQTELPHLRGETELAVYRVAQEALTNIARHSGAELADVELANGAGHLRLRVRDYGRGLREEGSDDGNGIRGMRERAAAMGGWVEVGRPATGPGSEVMLEVPLGASR